MEKFNSEFPGSSPDGRTGNHQSFNASKMSPAPKNERVRQVQQKTFESVNSKGFRTRIRASFTQISRKKTVALSLVASLFFSSCATIWNGKYQKVSVQGGQQEVLVNGKPVKPEQGAYLLERDRKTQTADHQKRRVQRGTLHPYAVQTASPLLPFLGTFYF